jgi:hypothetical protein
VIDLAAESERLRRLGVLDRDREDARDALLTAAEAVVDTQGDQSAV